MVIARHLSSVAKAANRQRQYHVRSYVLAPYTMVKDLRTEVETADAAGVLNGDIDQFLRPALALHRPLRKSSAEPMLAAEADYAA